MAENNAHADSGVAQRIDRVVLVCVGVECDPSFFQCSIELPPHDLRGGRAVLVSR